MKIVQVGAISTTIVMILGAAMVIPYFIHPGKPQLILLAFSINDDKNLPQWCNALASILQDHQIKASVFVTGKVANEYPECVSAFPKNVDVGSQTYDYISLSSIHDYTQQLEEIREGKIAVDHAGNVDSKLFRAPFGAIDENIYSLLNRAGISADFSYATQYNKYYDGKFIKFDADSYDGNKYSVDYIRSLTTDKPIIINFDNSTPVDFIDNYISKLSSSHIMFVSASDLTGMNLTQREVVNS